MSDEIHSCKKILAQREKYIDAIEQFLYLERNSFEHKLSIPKLNKTIKYSIDAVVQNKGYLEIIGWAFIEGMDSINSEIFIILKSDNVNYHFRTTRVKRTDLTAFFRTLNFDDAGFSLFVPLAVIKSDMYKVGIYVKKDDSEAIELTGNHISLQYWKDVSIPDIELSELVPIDIPIKIHESGLIDGNISSYELEVINKIIAFYKPIKMFEIGTFDGRTSLNMACNTAGEATIYTLDLPREIKSSAELPLDPHDEKYIDKENSGLRFQGTSYENKVVQLYGDSATFDFSSFYGQMDFVFIDGSHAYQYVLNDTEKSLKLLKHEKGILLWHDYDHLWEGVVKALNELYVNDQSMTLWHIKGTSFVIGYIPGGKFS